MPDVVERTIRIRRMPADRDDDHRAAKMPAGQRAVEARVGPENRKQRAKELERPRVNASLGHRTGIKHVEGTKMSRVIRYRHSGAFGPADRVASLVAKSVPQRLRSIPKSKSDGVADAFAIGSLCYARASA